MNFFDYILLSIIGIPTILALWMGLVRIAVLLVGLVVAFLAASHLSHLAAELLGNWIPNQTAADTAGFALVFVIVMVIAGLIGTLINKLFDLANISWLDRVLGMFVGTASGLLLIAVGFLIFTSYSSTESSWMKKSMLTPYALQMADMLGKSIPEEYPFSRQGTASKKASSKTTPNKGNIPTIPLEDKNALKSLIEDEMK